MRVVLMVIDGFGIGAMPDAADYGDTGANTALHVCQAVARAAWPNLQRLGLGNCATLLGHQLPGCPPAVRPLADFGVLAEASAAKDTTTGHWEMAGIVLDQPFATFPAQSPSFPADLLDALSGRTGYPILGNKAASGIAIIEELGARHLAGEGLIVYTSADSVLQIAAHEAVVPLAELYRICEMARPFCDRYRIGRVIARPFFGSPGQFRRSPGRRDYTMAPPAPTILDILEQHGIENLAIGKIGDLFSERGIAISHHDLGNDGCLARLFEVLGTAAGRDQLIFVNLIDTDMLHGHRRDSLGYHACIGSIDARLPALIELLAEDDLLIITSDHGCDPCFAGTDHTREYVPLLVGGGRSQGRCLGVRRSFADIAATLAAAFGVDSPDHGTSFLQYAL